MRLDVETGNTSRQVDLLALLDAPAEERAHEDAYTWIKALRHLRVDDVPFRNRFTFRGDSLWWFAELYLHKLQAIHAAMRVLHAMDALVARDRPRRIRVISGRYAPIAGAAAAAHAISYDGPAWNTAASALITLDARAIRLSAAARLSRLRTRPVAAPTAEVAAFVHRAFWRSGHGDGGAESYIGPVLRALEARLGDAGVRYVGVGPRTNFRARRWWDVLGSGPDDGITPIERYAPFAAMDASRALYGQRQEMRRRLWNSPEIRAHAVIRGVDCWPLVREQLAGIALLQFPWSARAMDEAAAALQNIRPRVAVTYAEAGGWGRAIALEARRLGIPLAGLQHGFIYRHWLNYRHEPDEMLPDPHNHADLGFPRPARTLLFDEHARAHLRTAGRFPDDALAVTGSARLDELVAAVGALQPDDLARVRQQTGAGERPLVVFAAKEREARGVLPALIAAVRDLPEIQLAIKPHPAETAAVYAEVTANVPNVRVLEPSTPLPALLGAATALVTVNSTVAIDALTLALPALVIGLPNNLSPFVENGVMLGARTADEVREGLSRVVYDRMFRSKLEHGRAHAAGHAADASADAILALQS